MAKEIVWSAQSILAFNKVIAYLEEEWSSNEIRKFILETERVIEFISEHPYIFRNTKYFGIREALITPHNLLVYKIEPARIVLITFWDTRQSPKRKKI
jgi:plasmid stabilization system protein ParE